ncbi:hypothetical protein ACCO45_012911 [Purpureocillium lilacinum]|uniref:Uncharacterized protein n=1 Tax=Purpureocillium lilacinum TaxID=33203 RepID=A0ACC4DAB6_PURLI
MSPTYTLSAHLCKQVCASWRQTRQTTTTTSSSTSTSTSAATHPPLSNVDALFLLRGRSPSPRHPPPRRQTTPLPSAPWTASVRGEAVVPRRAAALVATEEGDDEPWEDGTDAHGGKGVEWAWVRTRLVEAAHEPPRRRKEGNGVMGLLVMESGVGQGSIMFLPRMAAAQTLVHT